MPRKASPCAQSCIDPLSHAVSGSCHTGLLLSQADSALHARLCQCQHYKRHSNHMLICKNVRNGERSIHMAVTTGVSTAT